MRNFLTKPVRVIGPRFAVDASQSSDPTGDTRLTDPYQTTAALWSRFRFSVVGSLLSSPPAQGELGAAIRTLATKTWTHPVSGRKVRFAAVTIERWYYKARSDTDDPLGALRRAVRKDCGKASLASALAERLILQYGEHPQWSYQAHYDHLNALVNSDRSLAPLQSYTTVRRYMTAHALIPKPPQTKKLTLQIRAIPPHETEILERWRRSSNKRLWEKAVTLLDGPNLTLEELCAKLERSPSTLCRWAKVFNSRGIEGILRQKRDQTDSNRKLQVKTKRILEILHDRPRAFGINRSSWTRKALATAYEKLHKEAISGATVGRLIHRAGHAFKKARRVLTSTDPRYRERVLVQPDVCKPR